MSALPDSFRALVAEKQDDDVARGLRDLRADDLPDGDTVVRVDWSSVNYKDALAVSPKGRVAQISPLVPGVDLAGTVVAGDGEGSEVIVHGHDLGVAHHGGFAEYARVPGDWVGPLPDGLRELGESDVLSGGEPSGESKKPMEKQRWAAVVDPVGGDALAYALRTTR